MTISRDRVTLSKGRPGPRPRGRTVIPLTIAVTPAQRLSLKAVADVQKTSISAIVRQLIVAELAADVTIDP